MAVAVCPGCHDREPRTRGLGQQIFHFSLFKIIVSAALAHSEAHKGRLCSGCSLWLALFCLYGGVFMWSSLWSGLCSDFLLQGHQWYQVTGHATDLMVT